MKKWIIGIYVIVAVAALCLVVFLTRPQTPDVPTSPSTAPTQLTQPTTVPEPTGEVRLYQCDPGLAERWQSLAQRYTAETGVPVTILTPEGVSCAQALPQYLTGDDAATIFCLHHAQDLEKWSDYCLDLQGSVIAEALCQDIFALRDGDAILGVAGNIESYGIIYNSKLLARAGFTVTDIYDFQSLVNVAQNITANKKSLGFSAFASPDLEDTAHGAMLCLLAGLTQEETVLREFWDLYISNCVRSGSNLAQSTSADALTDFLNGKAVFYLGGTWDYQDLSKIEDYYLGMLPVYTSESQDNLGLHHACTSYWCVNSQANELDVTASLNFLGWLVSTDANGTTPVDALSILVPYVNTTYAGNPLEQLVRQFMAEERDNVHWNSCDELSPEVLEALGAALGNYAKKPNDDNWAAVSALAKAENAENPEA